MSYDAVKAARAMADRQLTVLKEVAALKKARRLRGYGCPAKIEDRCAGCEDGDELPSTCGKGVPVFTDE